MNNRMGYLTYILACIRNKPGRNLATIFCFAFIAASIFSGQYFLAGASSSVDQSVARMGADIIVVPPAYMVSMKGVGPNNTVAIVRSEPTIYRFKSDAMDQLGRIQGIQTMSPQLYVSTMNMPKLSNRPVDIYGIDPETDFTIQPWLQRPLAHSLAPGEIIIGHELAGNVSSRISILGQVYTIIGKLDPTQSRTDYSIFLRMDDAYALAAVNGIVPATDPRISNGDVNAILIRVTPGENPDKVVKNIKLAFAIEHLTAFPRHFSLDPMGKDVRGVPDLLTFISAIVVVAAFPLIGVIAAMVAHERQREIGILRSMGAKKKSIIFLVMAESLSLAAIGGVAGVLASFIGITLLSATGVLESALQVSVRFPTPAEIGLIAGFAILIVIAIGTLAALYPAYQSSTMNPYEAIRREGG
jgi:putative ABC transport system permease protein